MISRRAVLLSLTGLAGAVAHRWPCAVAYRSGLGLDLQKLAHEDMARNFAAYPRAGA
jgi:uncharacterized protein YijF (DUF1287 family)